MAFIIYTFLDLSTVLGILQAYLNLINPNFFTKKHRSNVFYDWLIHFAVKSW